MSIAMFPEIHHKKTDHPIDAVIEHLQTDNFTERDVEALSDLTKQDAATLAASWPNLSEITTTRLVRMMDELAESRVHLMFGRVLRIALTDRSAVVRQLAIDALWEDEGSDLCRRFIDILCSDPSPDVRAAAGMGLARYATMAACDNMDQMMALRIRDVLVSIAANNGEPYIVRRRALESVAVFGQQPEIRNLISEAYNADDAGMQAGALYAMGQSLDRRWVDLLVAELSSEDAEMRYESARALGEIGQPETVPDLGRAAVDEDAEVRQAAIIALGRIGGRTAIRILQELQDEASPADRDAIEEALDEAQSETLP